MSRAIKRSDCNGCYNEFYMVGGVNGTTKKCWMYDDANMTLGRILSIDQLPCNYKGRFVLIPSCYAKQRYFVQRKDDFKNTEV